MRRRVRLAVPHPRVTVRPSPGPRNSLWYVFRDVGFLRVVWNTFWVVLARYGPTFRIKNWFLRRTGARIGKGVTFGFDSTIDILFPQDITIGDDVVIGFNTTILCHGYLRHESQRGPVTIEKDASIGAGCMVLPGVTIGAGAVVGAMSVVNRDIPAGEFWAGNPARCVRGPSGERVAERGST